MTDKKLNYLEKIKPENSGLLSFAKKDFQKKLKIELDKAKNKESDNTNFLKFFRLFLLGKSEEFKTLLRERPDLVSDSRTKALKILNLLILGEKIKESDIFPFRSNDLVTKYKIENQISIEIISLYRLLKNNTSVLDDKKISLFDLVNLMPSFFYHLAKKILVDKEEDQYPKLEKFLAESKRSNLPEENPEFIELKKLETIRSKYIEALLASRTNNPRLEGILEEYIEIHQPDLEKPSKLIPKGLTSFYTPAKILDNWNKILEEATEIQSETEALSFIHKFTCDYFNCTDCCKFTFPTMSQTEFIYLKKWMKENNYDIEAIEKKSQAIQEDYYSKYGEKLKIIDKSKPENKKRGVENPHDYKFTCPFLSDEGACSCHPARPLLCRGFGSSTNNGISIKTCNFYLKQFQHLSSPENERYVFDLREFETLIRLSENHLYKEGDSKNKENSGTIVAWFSQN